MAGDFAKGFQLCLTILSLFESISMLCTSRYLFCYMYWIQHSPVRAPGSCRQWSKETLVCKSLVCFCLLSWTLLRVLESCCLVNVVVLNLCTLALQTLDCCVLSDSNNHNKFILFQRQRRPEHIKCKVTLVYLEIKASILPRHYIDLSTVSIYL